MIPVKKAILGQVHNQKFRNKSNNKVDLNNNALLVSLPDPSVISNKFHSSFPKPWPNKTTAQKFQMDNGLSPLRWRDLILELPYGHTIVISVHSLAPMSWTQSLLICFQPV